MRPLLLPFSGIFWLITSLRNLFYDWGWLARKDFDVPIISVGNLSVGGTGKSPMIIHLIKLLKDDYNLATLSRGYGRKTKGFRIAGYHSKVSDVGDEPLQFFNRFKSRILVTVGENRVNAVNEILNQFDSNVILLDDAFQHRRINPGFKILLTTYKSPFYNDYLLPAGNLRESFVGKKRADIIIVTKCPGNISEESKREIKNKIKPKDNQQLFFSSIKYPKQCLGKFHNFQFSEIEDYQVLLLSGIANPSSFENYVKENLSIAEHLKYRDHHNFTETDIDNILSKFSEIKSEKKIILTTEKDYMRLMEWKSLEEFLFYLPIEIELDNSQEFKKAIENYVVAST